MAEHSSRPPRQPAPSPDPDGGPQVSWRADDPILARWRANTFTYEEWVRALDAEQPDVIDALVDARKRGDAALVRELGARLVWGWVGVREAEEYGAILSFDDPILDDHYGDDELLHYLEGSVSARRMTALQHGAKWTGRERDWAHARAAEGFFDDPQGRVFEIVRVESRDGTRLFVAHILDGDYPCDSYFAGAADSIEAAREALKGVGYVSADDVHERYPATRAVGAAAVSFAMIEKEAVARIAQEKRRARCRTPRGSFDDHRARFKEHRGPIPAPYLRYSIARGRVIEAWACRHRGDEAGFAHYMALAQLAATKSLSSGPPVPIADRRPAPPESTE